MSRFWVLFYLINIFFFRRAMFYFSQGFIGKNTNEVHSKTTNNAGNVINKCCKIKALYFPDKSFIVQTDNDLIDKIIYFRKGATQLSSKDRINRYTIHTNKSTNLCTLYLNWKHWMMLNSKRGNKWRVHLWKHQRRNIWRLFQRYLFIYDLYFF